MSLDSRRPRITLIVALAFVASLAGRPLVFAAKPTAQPEVGDIARDFTLNTIDGDGVKLSALIKSGPVVLVVLRGYPGYQCPVCNVQVGQFLAKAKKFEAAKANVLLVYPGPADGLKDHAAEFIRGKTLPANVFLAIDPGYDFTAAYGLRWDAKNETAYPATFVIDSAGKIQFAKISMTHGNRASAEEVLKVLSGQ